MTNFYNRIVLLSVGQIGTYGLSFIRNIILARLLTKTEYGLAAALALTMSLLEIVSRMSISHKVIQAKEGDNQTFQAAAHAVQLLSGIISSILVIGFSYPMASIFKVPQLTWAFSLLAIIPLSRGIMHLDLARIQRQYNYLPHVINEIVPQLIVTAAVFPLVLWFGDFRVVLCIMVLKEILNVLISHILAENPYRWAWKREHSLQILIFSWPLLINGFLIFASQQGDQMLIGANFSLADLGTYSIAYTLSSVPFYFFSQVGTSMMLPILSRHQENFIKFKDNYCRCLELSVIIAFLFLGPLIIMGGPIVKLIYGTKYADVGVLIAIFSAVVAFRFFRWAPAIAAMSKADTKNQFIGNMARSISLVLALIILTCFSKELAIVAICGLFGELLAIFVSINRLWKRQKIDMKIHAKPIVFLIGWIFTGAIINMVIGQGISIWQGGLALFIFYLTWGILTVYIFPELIELAKMKFRYKTI